MRNAIASALHVALLVGAAGCLALCAGERAAATANEDASQRRVMQRFLDILEKSPRRGTALDRVYGYHVERGTLEQFAQSCRDKTIANPADGTAWMVLGLIESQRGRDAAAVQAFREVERHSNDKPLASYYLGQSLVLVGQPDQAVEAFERAIARKPERVDLLNVFQALGRVHQRAHHNEQALRVWDRLEKLFPDDQRVQEEIATILSDEGDHEGALKRFEALAGKSDDSYRRVQYGIKAGELKVQLGRTAEAIKDFEELLSQLKPDSWLFRDVRQRIEGVFLRTDDNAGLTEYYENWIETHSEDVDAMTRIGRALAMQRRLPEAQEWYAKAIKLAPSNAELRHSLIDQLIRDGKYAEAIAEYERLDEIDPNNPDNLEEWGQLFLRDKSRPEAERRRLAGEVWSRLVEARPDDAVTATQAADLFRYAKMSGEAIALYRKAVELAPDAVQYREYLGEYYHVLERPDDAIAVWRQIAEGEDRNTQNLVRLAEVYGGFGYREQALAAMTAACSMEPEFAERVRFAQMLRESEKYEDSLEQLDLAVQLAESPEERQLVLEETIKGYKASGKLTAQTEALQNTLQSGDQGTPERWRRLALYFEAGGKPNDATAAIAKALQLDDKSVPTWTAASRIYEASGQIGDAVKANRKLALIDRRYRTEYLTRVATLEMRLGRVDAAIQAGRDLIAAAPGDPEHYQFFADLCFQLGRAEQGLDALRRSVRVNPSDETALLALAGALSEQYRTDEAVELYWRAFERVDDLEGQLSIVGRLTELYLRTNRFDRLVNRLETRGRELDQNRAMTLCVASAHRAVGDLGSARQTLEALLTEDSRDTQLLMQLSQLAEQEDDVESAARYQRRINEIAPSKDGTVRLAQLLLRTGEIDEAEAVWTRMVEDEREPHRIYQAIDSLVTHSKYETALKLTNRMLREHPKDWETLYREGVILWKTDQKDEAAKRFQAIVALKVDDDEKSASAKQLSTQKTTTRTYGVTASQRLMSSYPAVLTRTQAAYQIRRTLGMDPDRYYGSTPSAWSPPDFGQARVAALACLYTCAESDGKRDEFVAELRERAEEPDSSERSQWDWVYLQAFLQYGGQGYRGTYEAVRRLSQNGSPEACLLYLNTLPMRNYSPGMRSSREAIESTPPLSDEELKHLLNCYNTIVTQRPEWNMFGRGSLQTVLTELERAERKDEADELYHDAVAAADTAQKIQTTVAMAAHRGDMETTLKMLDRLGAIQGPKSRSALPGQTSQDAYALAQLMAKRAEEKAHEDILTLLDHHLVSVRKLKARSQRTRRYSSSSSAQSYNYIQLFTDPKNPSHVQLEYPLPNEHFDLGSIALLRNAYAIYKRDDLLSDLFAHLAKQAEESRGEDRVFICLAMSYLHWWEDEKDEAAVAMDRAVEAAPDDVELRLELAKLRQQLGDAENALALIDAVEPLDHAMMQRRELMALQLAVQSGNIERARKAAERLFGLRLNAEIQVQLASQMHQLGMHELAEGVLARARRRGGNKSATLIALMQQYQSQGNSDVAVQIAYQILRRATPGSATSGQSSESDAGRQQAMQVLARSGRLEELIERAEAQLERSPESVRLHQTLADYYKAAGKQDKSQETLEKMASLRPEDARLQYELAKQLYSSGDRNAAVDHYLAAFKKEPSLFAQDYHRMTSVFQSAKRLDDLLAFLNEVDLKKIGRYYALSDIIRNLMRDNKTQAQALQLFKRAWAAYPDQRHSLMSNMYREEIWKIPEMYDYAVEAILPKPNQPLPTPWSGMDRVMSYSSGGQATGVLTRVVKAAEQQNRLKAFRDEVTKALKQSPDWIGGEALLALLDAKQGQKKSARERLTKLLDDDKTVIPLHARWLIGQELESVGGMDDLALRLYEEGRKDFATGRVEFSYSPARRLVGLYAKAGRKQEARDLMLELYRSQDYSRQSLHNPGYGEYQELRNAEAVASELLKMGAPIDAFRLYNEALADSSKFEAAQRWGGGSRMKERMESGLKKARDALTAEALETALQQWIRPRTESNAESSKSEPAVDLVMLVQPRVLSEAAVTSLFQMAVNTAGENEKGTSILEKARAGLGKLREDGAADLSVYVADALVAFAEKEPQRRADSLSRLVELVESTPLDSLEKSARPNARQREQAARQMALWLVAHEAMKDESTRTAGERLATRALEAARRQTDNTWALAMLRQRGHQALETSDRTAAEKHWSEMLDVILARPMAKKKSTVRSR